MNIAFEPLGMSGPDLLWSLRVQPLLAYIDPGLGSLVLQVILGTALACVVAIKLYWRRLKVFVGKLARRDSGSKVDRLSEETKAGTGGREGSSNV